MTSASPEPQDRVTDVQPPSIEALTLSQPRVPCCPRRPHSSDRVSTDSSSRQPRPILVLLKTLPRPSGATHEAVLGPASCCLWQPNQSTASEENTDPPSALPVTQNSKMRHISTAIDFFHQMHILSPARFCGLHQDIKSDTAGFLPSLSFMGWPQLSRLAKGHRRARG